ncbi:unnamed protein product [Blepharisma stoltei]|uniref:Ubiquitin-like domain-containing protein n=1 Tax=Blepharisma stoltei TaxID=1481888 RepID=A0AAU9J3J7_9CILI|nr:unnamed protein product [Blepharisma stoltei]
MTFLTWYQYITFINMQISVRASAGNFIKLNAESSETLEDLKLKIQEKEGIPIDQQRLFFNYNELEDCHSLAHYNIQEQSMLYLVLGPRDGGILMTIIVEERCNNHYEICINSRDTILHLKCLLKDLSGITINHQLLLFGKNTLQSYSTIESYGICPGTILHLAERRRMC